MQNAARYTNATGQPCGWHFRRGKRRYLTLANPAGAGALRIRACSRGDSWSRDPRASRYGVGWDCR